jgi:hypothetical protein
VIAVREIRLQGGTGEIIKVRWRLAGKDSMKERLQKRRSGLMVALFTMGRRDFYIFAFLIYALLGFSKLALVHAVLIGGPLAVVAGAQVIWRMRGSRE